IQHCPESSIENVHLELTLRYSRDHNLHLDPFHRWAPLYSILACSFELHDRDIASANPGILGAAVGCIGKQETAFICRNLCSNVLRIPKILFLRWAAIATGVMRRRRRSLRRG